MMTQSDAERRESEADAGAPPIEPVQPAASVDSVGAAEPAESAEPAASARPVDATRLDPELRVPRDAYDRFRAHLHAAVERLAGKLGTEAVGILLLVPDLLLLFAGLARDSRVDRRHKLLAGAAAAYLLSPVDLLPEALLGPLGMGDDIIVAFLALDALLNHVPRHVLIAHWRGDRDLLEVARLGSAIGSRLVPRPIHDRVRSWLERRAAS